MLAMAVAPHEHYYYYYYYTETESKLQIFFSEIRVPYLLHHFVQICGLRADPNFRVLTPLYQP